MHRSGTSYLVRTLNLSGLWIGAENELNTVEGRAMIGNPKGNYENSAGIAINDNILQRSGGAWYNPPKQVLATEDDLQRIRAFCAGLEHGRPADFPRWGWKDPRTVLTLEAWLAALKRDIFIVASFRHPSSVARSLLARDGIPLEAGYALWGFYNSLLLRHLQARPHALVRFDIGKEALARQVADVCRRTGLRSEIQRIAAWYDAELVRSKPATDTIGAARQVEPLWNQLVEMHRSVP
jgi:hypothetical protein